MVSHALAGIGTRTTAEQPFVDVYAVVMMLKEIIYSQNVITKLLRVPLTVAASITQTTWSRRNFLGIKSFRRLCLTQEQNQII